MLDWEHILVEVQLIVDQLIHPAFIFVVPKCMCSTHTWSMHVLIVITYLVE